MLDFHKTIEYQIECFEYQLEHKYWVTEYDINRIYKDEVDTITEFKYMSRGQVGPETLKRYIGQLTVLRDKYLAQIV